MAKEMGTTSCLTHANVKRIGEIMKLDKQGGKMVQRDDFTVVIADCSKITDAQIRAMRIEYPHVYIEIVGSSGSMSGFCIIVHASASRSTVQNAHVVAVLLQSFVFLASMYGVWSHAAASAHII